MRDDGPDKGGSGESAADRSSRTSGGSAAERPDAGVAASTPPEWVRCPSCRASNIPDAHYCENCGTELSNPDAATLLFDPRAPRAKSGDQEMDRRSPGGGGPGGDVPVLTDAISGESAEALLQIARRELADDYEVEREIGRGGMAIVIRAVEHQLRRPVALKILPPELALGAAVVERFKREAQMAAALDHPNIIPIYRVGQSESLLYLAMKLVEGRALDGVLASQGALPIPVVLLVLRAATDALTFAHEHGIVHRDIKGGNILIDREGRVIVTDFGVARAIENASMTTTGSVIGTPYFMSPEQCAGKVARPQSDQYSLGVVAFQMLTGTVPFQADTLAAIMHHHFFTPAPDVSMARQDAPPELVMVLNRVLAKDPDRRYATTREMRAAVAAVPLSDADRAEGEAMLRSLAEGSTVPAVRTDTLPPLADTMTVVAAHDAFRRSADRVRRIRWQLGWGGALAVIFVVVISLWVRPKGSRPTRLDVDVVPATGAAAVNVPPAAMAPVIHPNAAAPPVGPPAHESNTDSVAKRGKEPRHSAAPHHEAALPAATPPATSEAAAPADTVRSTGKLRVRVLPSGADIFIDGQPVGQGAVFDLDVLAGKRRLHILGGRLRGLRLDDRRRGGSDGAAQPDRAQGRGRALMPLRRSSVRCWPALIAGVVTVMAMGPRSAAAQGNTDETLQRAIHLYENLQVERALALLRDVVSPSTPFVVSPAQRVTAYKYLGAAHAILGERDSATVYFRAALERDPFVDLDAEEFTARERELFDEAKQRTFAVAVRPIARTRIDPRTEHITFVLLSTHGAQLSAEIRNAAGEASPIFQSENDGVREVAWNGVLASGRLASPGRYELVVRGVSRLDTGRADSARVFFTVEQDRQALEDSLPALQPTDLLPEHYPSSAATGELAKGLGVGLAAIAIPALFSKGEFSGPSRALAATVTGGGIVIGVLGFRWRREHSEIAANVAENARRRAAHAATNAEIADRNESRIAVTALIISPAAGAVP